MRKTPLLLVGLLPLIIPARAQTGAAVKEPIVLDSKTASRLALTQTKPEYPAIAKQNYIHGKVRLQIQVTREGRVRSAHVIHGHPFLAASALEVVRHWRYRPFSTASGPAEFSSAVEMNFTLRTRKIEQVPRQPEQDLSRQIRPPEIIDRSPARAASGPSSASVKLRLLLDSKGQIIDVQPLAGLPSDFEVGRERVEHWRFRPAHWGSLPVPWYLEVDVPIGDSNVHHGAAEPGRMTVGTVCHLLA